VNGMTGNGKTGGSDQHNPMHPQLGRLAGRKDLGTDIKLLQIEMIEPVEKVHNTDYRPGQFAFLSVLGIGEVPFGFASTSSGGDMLEFSIAKVGRVTSALHSLEVAEFLKDYL